MKNLKLLCLSLLLAGSASAQYFQLCYGSQRTDILESGINIVPTQGPNPMQGHILAGYTDFPGINSLAVTGTDMNGKIAGPNGFNNWYRITEPNQPPLDVKGRRVVQEPGGRILVFGDYGYNAGSASTKFFYTLLGPNGVPTGVCMSYSLPFAVSDVEATSMTLSTAFASLNYVYVCG